MKKYLLLFIPILLFFGCAHTPNRPEIDAHQVAKLNIMLDSLHVNHHEAEDLAQKAIMHAHVLASQYHLVTPPVFQNFLVNIGLKDRGLCWQFANDMLSFVKEQHYQSFDYYIGGANIGDYWREHNVLVITCKGCPFEQGIVLDPWRNSGDLFFCKVTHDTKYKWSQRGGLR